MQGFKVAQWQQQVLFSIITKLGLNTIRRLAKVSWKIIDLRKNKSLEGLEWILITF